MKGKKKVMVIIKCICWWGFVLKKKSKKKEKKIAQMPIVVVIPYSGIWSYGLRQWEKCTSIALKNCQNTETWKHMLHQRIYGVISHFKKSVCTLLLLDIFYDGKNYVLFI